MCTDQIWLINCSFCPLTASPSDSAPLSWATASSTMKVLVTIELSLDKSMEQAKALMVAWERRDLKVTHYILPHPLIAITIPPVYSRIHTNSSAALFYCCHIFLQIQNIIGTLVPHATYTCISLEMHLAYTAESEGCTVGKCYIRRRCMRLPSILFTGLRSRS